MRLCDKFRDQGVVAIDIAGDENMVEDGTPTDPLHFEAFKVMLVYACSKCFMCANYVYVLYIVCMTFVCEAIAITMWA